MDAFGLYRVTVISALASGSKGDQVTGSNPLEGFFSLLGVVAVLVGVLFLAYYCTKFIGRRYSGQNLNGRNMRVIEQLPVGRDRSLCIVRVGEKVFLLGVTPNHIERLDELNPGDYPETDDVEPSDFSSLLKDSLNKGFGFSSKNKRESDENEDR